MSNKYFIYVRGLWRELSTESGRVCGAKVKFLCMRDGSLQAASRSAVLRGLKALAAGAPSAVKDGPRLSYSRHWSGKLRKRRSLGVSRSPCRHHCRCSHNYKSCHVQKNNVEESTIKITSVLRVDASTQVSQTLHKTNTHTNTITSKRNDSNSSDSVFQQKPAFVRKNKRKTSTSVEKSPAKKRRNSSSETDVFITRKQPNRTIASSTASDDVKKNKLRITTNKRTSVRSSSSQDVAVKKLKKKAMPKRKRLKSISTDSEVSLQKPILKKTKIAAETSPSLLTRNVNTDTKKSQETESDTCLELEIDEDDVALIRQFLRKLTFLKDFDVAKYDTDDDYKRRIFYMLHPCVNLERRNLAGRAQSHSEMLLEDFASNLGLQKVGTSSQSKRYRMRKRVQVSSSASDINKENEIGERRNRRRNKELPSYIISSESEEEIEQERRVEGSSSASDINKENEIGERRSKRRNKELPSYIISTESEEEIEQERVPLKREIEQERVPFKKVSPRVKNVKLLASTKQRAPKKLASGREYSAAEDACIVRWVSAGRERRVNGNLVWQELQETYPQLTNQVRSWHSLRNRYLRYILPSLAHTHVSPQQAQRLRAAASIGEIKSKRRVKDNSIFRERPVASAWSRRPKTHTHNDTNTRNNATYNNNETNTRNNNVTNTRNSRTLANNETKTRSNVTNSRSNVTNTRSNTTNNDTHKKDTTHDATEENGDTEVLSRKRSLRSSAPFTSPHQPPTTSESPTYESITRRFASRHHSTPEKLQISQHKRRKLYNPNDAKNM